MNVAQKSVLDTREQIFFFFFSSTFLISFKASVLQYW